MTAMARSILTTVVHNGSTVGAVLNLTSFIRKAPRYYLIYKSLCKATTTVLHNVT